MLQIHSSLLRAFQSKILTAFGFQLTNRWTRSVPRWRIVSKNYFRIGIMSMRTWWYVLILSNLPLPWTPIYSFCWASTSVASLITVLSSQSSRMSYGCHLANSPGSSQQTLTTLIVCFHLLWRSFVGHYIRWREGENLPLRQQLTAHTMKRRWAASTTSGAWGPTISNCSVWMLWHPSFFSTEWNSWNYLSSRLVVDWANMYARFM